MSAEARGARITAEGLRKSYRRRAVLQVEHLDVPAGSTLGIIGPSGAGKSTLLQALGLLLRPDAGEVRYDGEPVRAGDPRGLRRVAAVFQRPHLFTGTVGHNVGYGLRLRGVPAAERARLSAEALERVGLPGWEGRSALTLSGGEAQRVALARALVLRPDVLLLDEPLSSLDPLLKERLLADLARIVAEEHTTTLYVTHDQDEALVLADRVAVMYEGRVVAQGEAAEVMGLPRDPWVAGFVGMEPPARGRVVSVSQGLAEVDCGGVTLAAVGTLPAGTEVLLGVRPEDVTIFESGVDLPHSSARNRLAATVTEVRRRGAAVRVVLETGPVRLAASVSRASAEELALVPGAAVTALFKATAVRMAVAEADATPRADATPPAAGLQSPLRPPFDQAGRP